MWIVGSAQILCNFCVRSVLGLDLQSMHKVDTFTLGIDEQDVHTKSY